MQDRKRVLIKRILAHWKLVAVILLIFLTLFYLLPSPGPKQVGQLSVVFAIILRDQVTQLPFVTNNIQRLAVKFKSSSIVFVENDSTDGSQAWIKNYKTKVNANMVEGINDVDLVSFSWSGKRKQISILARARNEVLKKIFEPKYLKTDFLIVLDSDLCYLWDIDNMVSVLDDILPYHGSHWDVLFSNGVKKFEDSYPEHYDKFVYRDRIVQWNPSKGFNYQAGWKKKLGHMQHWFDNGWMNPWNCTPFPGRYHYDCMMVGGQPLIQVDSAFGGLAFYSTKFLFDDINQKLCWYSSPFEDCEHVAFNLCLKDRFKAKLVVAPRLVISLGMFTGSNGCRGEFKYNSNVTKMLSLDPKKKT